MAEIKTPCPACGNKEIAVEQLALDDRPSFFIRCNQCDSVCTVTHAVREEAIKKWEKLWCWDQLAIAHNKIAFLEAGINRDIDRLTDDQKVLKYRFEVLLDHYIRMRMDYSGSWGNLSPADRRRVMIKELSAELGWDI